MLAALLPRSRETGVDRTLFSRYEIKYFVPEGLVPSLRRFIAPFVVLDRHSAKAPDRRYAICSLYLDTPDLRLMRQTTEGEKNRAKLRVRTYDDDPASPVFVEIKRRTNGIIRKRRSALERGAALSLLRGGVRGGPSVGAAAREFAVLARAMGAGPMLRVGYLREAYESAGGDPVRITFDTRCRYRSTAGWDLSHDGTGWRPTSVEGTILEIKFTERYPSWVADLIRCFQLRRRSIAKYVLSMRGAMHDGDLMTVRLPRLI